MPFKETGLMDLKVFIPTVYEDDRGYFFESFNDRIFEQEGIITTFVQDNQAKSDKGVLRGLHYQVAPHGQAKLVRVIAGSVLDVVVDIRPKSPTYGMSYKIILSAVNKKQLFVPRGFAHGYLALEDNTIFFYKCDNFYSKESEGGIFYEDPSLKIDWGYEGLELIISDKDKIQPHFEKHRAYE